ncbi:putative DNA polymerase kappa [Leishmania braziliensis MHOM/BR/75/M2904]|uniref:DNA polymerase kappa n=2 Tax=Leishmania braziliensis TaxID=5660 RepID=A4HGJ3_LEIBR|nr:putative DNA polymerase kappa [Leishmania braziliensis MHOM/BR/75/M2904]KAI5685785.1 impB [Leishmania braziliensis]CAJ2475859.1 unnamed protein product [Leishmania braziliensis]CAM39687.1 putative DNA polymerase kappa [Leishmania braziliensis MHOM/BR/75/M2904]SYZ67338.1 DNA_polymerase_kappa [Leishmania braziliensis MHOM/BR/75/M2904]
MSAERDSSAPVRSSPSDVRTAGGQRLSLITCRTAITPPTVPPRTLSPLPPVFPIQVVTRTTSPTPSTVHTPVRGMQISSDNHENLNSSSGSGGSSHNTYKSVPSSAPTLGSSPSCSVAADESSRGFLYANTSSVGGTAVPKVVFFDNTKAGLHAVDKAKTEALITALSKNSDFYINEERKAQRRKRQIEGLLVKTRQYEGNVCGQPDVFRQLQRDVADLEASFEMYRSFDSIYVHVDMDMFYAAVEMKKNPQYAEVPLGVGSMAMLSTTNYLARQYGVRSGMPGFIGMRLCPQLVIVPTDFAACRVESAKFKGVVRNYDPAAQVLGMDEIMMRLDDYLAQHHMDATTHAERFDVAERIIEECRRRVAEVTGLTASAGIAPTPTLAKMASDYKKPNGQFAVRLFSREAVMDYLASIPVRRVPGIGKSRESILAGLGIHTLGEVYQQRHRLFYILTRKTYEFLLASAMGVGGMYDSLEAAPPSSAGTTTKTVAALDGESNEDDWRRKSVGQERTFYKLKNRMELQAIAHMNLRQSHETLVAEDLLCSQVVLKLKHRSFHVKQHSKSLNLYTDDYEVLRRALDDLLLPVVDDFAKFRLLGIRLEKLRRRPQNSGAGGAIILTVKSTAEAESTQPTLSHFFARQSASAAHPMRHTPQKQQQQLLALRKRYRDTSRSGEGNDSSADLSNNGDEDGAVLVVSSESQLTDVEEVNGPMVSCAAPSPHPGLCTAPAAKEQKKAHDEEVGSDGSADDDVVIVE